MARGTYWAFGSERMPQTADADYTPSSYEADNPTKGAYRKSMGGGSKRINR